MRLLQGASFAARRKYWHDLGIKCDDIVNRLETVHPLVIDYFLGWNPSLREIGKLLIAGVLLKCEADFFEAKAKASKKIRTIDPIDKQHEPTLAIAKESIRNSEHIYILGYGFDPNNNKRIGLDALASRLGVWRQVFFTNYRDANAVNKRFGQMCGSRQMFLNDSVANNQGNGFEKSIRDVYEAIELDFGMI